jgi:hypothetical protein
MVSGALAALLLCGKNFFLELRETVSHWLAPCVAFFLLGSEVRHLSLGQILSCQKSCSFGVVFFQAVLGMGRGFRRCFGPATVSSLPLCSDSRQG